MKNLYLCKTRHRALFVAMQADVKAAPGRIVGLAAELDVNASTLANQLNPDHESRPPSLATVIEILLRHGDRTIFQLCELAGKTPMDQAQEDENTEDAIRIFLDLMTVVSKVIGDGSQFAVDNKFDSLERKKLLGLLVEMQKQCAVLMRALSEV